MITTFSGKNGYLIKSKVNALVVDFKKNHDALAVERINIEDVEFNDFKQSLLGNSLFSSSRLVILDTPSISKEFMESFEEISDSLTDTTDLIIIEPSVDKRSSYFKFLQKTNFTSCDNLNEFELVKWVVQEAKKLNGIISSSDGKFLIDRVGDDQLLLRSELEKLILYDPKISRDSIELLTEQSPASTIFQLLDAAFNNQTKSALLIYDKQRKLKVAPELILTMFVWQLQIIAVCLTAGDLNVSELASKSKLSPFSLRNGLQIAKRINLSDLKKIIGKLISIDYRSKTISYNLDQALMNFIVETATSF